MASVRGNTTESWSVRLTACLLVRRPRRRGPRCRHTQHRNLASLRGEEGFECAARRRRVLRQRESPGEDSLCHSEGGSPQPWQHWAPSLPELELGIFPTQNHNPLTRPSISEPESYAINPSQLPTVYAFQSPIFPFHTGFKSLLHHSRWLRPGVLAGHSEPSRTLVSF